MKITLIGIERLLCLTELFAASAILLIDVMFIAILQEGDFCAASMPVCILICVKYFKHGFYLQINKQLHYQNSFKKNKCAVVESSMF